MQLATSASLPSDPNLLALMFCGAASAAAGAGPAPACTATLLADAGFEALLPAEPSAAAPASAVPLDLRSGMPSLFGPSPAASGPSPVGAAAAPDATPPVACAINLTAESETAKPGEAAPRLAPRGARAMPRVAAAAPAGRGGIASDEIETSTAPKPDAALLAATGWLPPVKVDSAPVAMPLDAHAAHAEVADEDFAGDPAVRGAFSPEEPAVHPEHTTILRSKAGEPQPNPPAAQPEGASFRPPAMVPKPSEPAALRIEAKLAAPPGVPPLPSAGQDRAASKPDSAEASPSVNAAEGNDPTATFRSLPGLRTSREKIAVMTRQDPETSDEPVSASDKTFVAAEPEVVAQRERIVGTEAAKFAPHMPATPSSPSSPLNAMAPSTVLPATGPVERVESHNVLTLALDGVRTAHEAVEVVLRTADRLSSLTHKAVRLEFSVGDERLGVRVELRANEVRTTFHTESPELRGALAAEWQSVSSSAGSGERTLRILPAQFGAAGQDAAGAFSGDASSRHREPPSQAQAGAMPAPAPRGRAARDSRAPDDARPLEAAFAAPATALHLHMLA